MTGHKLGSLGNNSSHRPWDCDPLYPAARYAWVMEGTPNRISTATEASLLKDAAKPGPTGMSHMQKEVACPKSIVRCHTGEGRSPSDSFATQGASWDSLSEQQLEFTHFPDFAVSVIHVGAQWNAAALSSLTRVSLINYWAPGVCNTDKTSGSHLRHWTPCPKIKKKFFFLHFTKVFFHKFLVHHQRSLLSDIKLWDSLASQIPKI